MSNIQNNLDNQDTLAINAQTNDLQPKSDCQSSLSLEELGLPRRLDEQVEGPRQNVWAATRYEKLDQQAYGDTPPPHRVYTLLEANPNYPLPLPLDACRYLPPAELQVDGQSLQTDGQVAQTNGQVAPETPPRRGGRRTARKSPKASPEEEAKQEVIRERNRSAAAKCRQRKLDTLNSLVAKVEVLQAEIQELESVREENAVLRAQLKHAHLLMSRHDSGLPRSAL